MAVELSDIQYIASGVDSRGVEGALSSQIELASFDLDAALRWDLVLVYDLARPRGTNSLYGTWVPWLYIYKPAGQRGGTNYTIPAVGDEVVLDLSVCTQRVPPSYDEASEVASYDIGDDRVPARIRAPVVRSDVWSSGNYLNLGVGGVPRWQTTEVADEYIGRVAIRDMEEQLLRGIPVGTGGAVQRLGPYYATGAGSIPLDNPAKLAVAWRGSLSYGNAWSVPAAGQNPQSVVDKSGRDSASKGKWSANITPSNTDKTATVSATGRDARGAFSWSSNPAEYYRPDLELQKISPRLALGGALWKLTPTGRVEAGRTHRVVVSFPHTTDEPSRARKAALYKRDGNAFGFVDFNEVSELKDGRRVFTFFDDGIPPDLSLPPPERVEVLDPVSGKYPAVAARYEQRYVLAGGSAGLATLWFGNPGSEFLFQRHETPLAVDAFERELSGARAAKIEHMLPGGGGLLVLTSAGEWVISGGGQPIEPATANAIPGSYIGSSEVVPVQAHDRVLLVSPGKRNIHALQAEAEAGRFNIEEVTILARDLFAGWEITQMTWDESGSTLFILTRRGGTGARYTVRRLTDEGGVEEETVDRQERVWACTYLPEQEVIAFSHLDFNFQGFIRDIQVLGDTLYIAAGTGATTEERGTRLYGMPLGTARLPSEAQHGDPYWQDHVFVRIDDPTDEKPPTYRNEQRNVVAGMATFPLISPRSNVLSEFEAGKVYVEGYGPGETAKIELGLVKAEAYGEPGATLVELADPQLFGLQSVLTDRNDLGYLRFILRGDRIQHRSSGVVFLLHEEPGPFELLSVALESTAIPARIGRSVG